MPFDSYGQNINSPFPDYDDQHLSMNSGERPSPSNGSTLQFQLPSFMYSGAPTLAPGGGAEVLPVGMLHDTAWFSNNGFTPRFSDDSFFPPKGLPTVHQLPDQRQQEQQQHASASGPFDFEAFAMPISPPSPPTPAVRPGNPPSDLSMFMAASADMMNSHAVTAPSPFGLPVYSTSGFDLLSVLARVATRPNPRVVLGPVDLTCSFVVVDVRRHDHPIIYCSPSFCHLTGYEESEVLNRNCRFLQSPTGQLQRGEERHFTSPEAVTHLRKSLVADKECQTSLVNYKKGGHAFINLVTVIPITGGEAGLPGEEGDIIYHVGFQVDLTEQPNAILEKLRDGSYIVNYSQGLNLNAGPGQLHHGGMLVPGLGTAGPVTASRDRKTHVIPPVVMSKELKKLLANPQFVKSIPISTTTIVPPPLSASGAGEGQESATASAATAAASAANGSNQHLHLLLLEACPDFIHVVSLKGTFLYVAPSVRRVLGYEPEEMVGKSIADFTHPEDVVPLMRELKESSATGMTASGTNGEGESVQMQATPRTVDLLFRARTKVGAYVWVECRGRLHVEPGKGRKAIMLSGRAREMVRLGWEAVERGGGLARSVKVQRPVANPTGEGPEVEEVQVETEFWGMMNGEGKGRGMLTFSMVGNGVQDVLGWTPTELIGRGVSNVLLDEGGAGFGLEDEVARMHSHIGGQEQSKPRKIRCRMRRKDGGIADVLVVLYRPARDPLVAMPTVANEGISPPPLICQVKLFDATTIGSLPSSSSLASAMFSPLTRQPSPPAAVAHSPTANVFEELETSRGSSWQYELQQLKFANQRLLEEVTALEARGAEASPASAALMNPPGLELHPTGTQVGMTPSQPQPMHAYQLVHRHHARSPLYVPSPPPQVRSVQPGMERPLGHAALAGRLPRLDASVSMHMPGQGWPKSASTSMGHRRHQTQQQRVYSGPVSGGGAGVSLKRSWHAMEGRPQ